MVCLEIAKLVFVVQNMIPCISSQQRPLVLTQGYLIFASQES